MTKVGLVPWDPSSEEQVQRLTAQRVQCGWDAELVEPSWTEWQKAGRRCLYWLTVPEDEPELQEGLKEHFENNPTYKTALRDTCNSVRGLPRGPSGLAFCPIGHITLDTDSVHAEQAGMELEEESLYWIGPLYVAKELRAIGIGREAMDAMEALAVEAPLNARKLGLDCLARKHQQDPAFIAANYKGVAPKTTNQDWYERRGFKEVATAENIYGGEADDGTVWDMTAVFMKKALV